jgi:alpha-galactosidase
MRTYATRLAIAYMRARACADSGVYTCSTGGRPFQIPGSYGYYAQVRGRGGGGGWVAVRVGCLHLPPPPPSFVWPQDAATFASWGVTYVKMDWVGPAAGGGGAGMWWRAHTDPPCPTRGRTAQCNTVINGTQLDPRQVYPIMSKGLNATGVPMFFESCQCGMRVVGRVSAGCP